LVLSSRYIHTGNSGVTLTLRRDLVRNDRAELEVENGAFGAFHTSMLVRGHDTSGMTSIQLRDLALMFLDAADALDNDCKIPLRSGRGESISSLGRENKAYLIPEGGGRREDNAPQSLRRYIPGQLGGIPLDPGIDLSAFAEAQRSRKAETGAGHEEKTAQKMSPSQKKSREDAWLERQRREYTVHAGWDFLLAKRLTDLVTPFFEKTKRDFEVSDHIKFGPPPSFNGNEEAG
jgi:hypothetical protein